MPKCLWCDCELKESPTSKFWIKKDYDSGICHLCVLSLARDILRGFEQQAEEEIEKNRKTNDPTKILT